MFESAYKPYTESSDMAIVVDGLTKIYTINGITKAVVDGVSFKIKKGSIYGILGPNGAGKSTTINIISGIIKGTSGRVIIDGIDLSNDVNSCKRKIGTAMQEAMLDPFFKVDEYLRFTAGYYGIARLEAKRRIEEVCTALDLTPHLKKGTRELSGGMKRRLIIAKALLHDPDILILDEPTAGVDIEMRSGLWAYIKQLNRKGKTIILTTHYLEEAQEFCDRIAFMDSGKIVLEDSKTNILSAINPKKLRLTIEHDPNFVLPENCVYMSSKSSSQSVIEFTYGAREADKPNLENLLSVLHSSGVKVKDISSFESSLDDIFRSVIKIKNYQS